ncbi:MAG: helicase-exonuclease AddAB subunit AddA [Ruminococcaceae bacterium]|nr:helicase-exonuclease AddAB subunit AddA [Oscillospiraceae bacterium]
MSVNWTSPQKNAIEDNGGTLLVSAAAGSGKTAVLVERAVRLITDAETHVSADRLLIVTFTRAAAEELRSRISARLARAAADNPDSIFLRRQYILLGRASICTIDAFCQQLLRRYFSELGIPPDFKLLSDADAFTMRQNALAEVMEQMCADKAFCDFASLYGRARSDSRAASAVLSLYDFLRSLPYPHKALEEICAAYETALPLSATKWGIALLKQAEKAADSAYKLLQSAQKIIINETPLEPYSIAIGEDLRFLEVVLQCIKSGRWDDARIRVQEYAPANFKQVRGYESDGKEQVKRLRAEFKDMLKMLTQRVFVCSEAEFEADRAECAPMVKALASAALLLEDKFYTSKLAEKKLEYSDFEHLSLKLLCDENGDKTALAAAVSKGFDAVMVDEYQDTNAIQALLYKCLANDDESNLFFVGDVKQSIYRFRLANPESFINKRESFAPYDAKTHPATVILGHNFRSTPSVIGQINDVFSCLMSRSLGDVEYDASERLYTLSQADLKTEMQLKILALDEASDALTQAAQTAKMINDMVKNGVTVRSADGERPCEWGDFCILLRSRKMMPLFEAELSRLGAPCYADTTESWLTAAETAPVLSMLRVIDNAAQDVAMASALLSPLFAFTPDDLTRLRLMRKKGSLYAALINSSEPKCVHFCTVLRRLRALAATETVETLCDELFAETHYFAAVSAMENGAARRDNLRSLTGFARGIEQSLTGGLSSFLRVIDSMLDSNAPQGADADAKPVGSVAIMTIHRSKGLEFPIVILADTTHKFNFSDTIEPVLFHPALGLGFNLRMGDGSLYRTAPHSAIYFAQKAEAVSEEMRILYVALTRARDRLIITAAMKRPEAKLQALATMLAGTNGADAYVLAQSNNYADWLLTAALLHPDCENLRKAAGAAMLPLYEAEGHFAAEIIAPEAAQTQDEAEEFTRKTPPDEALVNTLLDSFDEALPLAALSTLPAKLSVSEITHRAAVRILARPDFMYKEGLTGAEMGTAQHAFMQFADFAAGKKDIEAEINRLSTGGFISAEIAEKLPRDALSQFLSSPLVSRMQSADKLLREYDFITAVSAKFIQDMPKELETTPVYVQGIADAVLINGENAEIVDYKTDAQKNPQYFIDSYAEQLRLYKAAVEKRLGLKVTACTIYSLAMQKEVAII